MSKKGELPKIPYVNSLKEASALDMKKEVDFEKLKKLAEKLQPSISERWGSGSFHVRHCEG